MSVMDNVETIPLSREASAANKAETLETERLLVLAAQADPAKFGELYELYFDKIYHFLLSRSGARELAEDLTSQTFIKALEKIGQFKWRGTSFGAWLYRIAINNLNSHWRKNKRLINMDDENLICLADSRQPVNSQQEEANALSDLPSLYAAMKKLSADEQNLIALKYFQEKNYQEIGEIVNLSVTAVGVKLHRALKKIKAVINNPSV